MHEDHIASHENLKESHTRNLNELQRNMLSSLQGESNERCKSLQEMNGMLTAHINDSVTREGDERARQFQEMMCRLESETTELRTKLTELAEQTHQLLDSEGQTRQEGDAALRNLINESISHEGEVRNAQIQDLSKVLSEGFQSQSSNIESEAQARQEADAALRSLINDSVSHECEVRNAQFQDLSKMLSEGFQSQSSNIESEARARQEADAALRSLINESVSHESNVRNTQLQELAKWQSDGFTSQSKTIESEHEAWQQALQELNVMLRAVVNESVSRESNERGMQLQEMMRRLEKETVDHNTKLSELMGSHEQLHLLHRNLETSHAELSSKLFDGDKIHMEKYSRLESRLEEHRETHHNLLEEERRQRAQSDQKVHEMLDATLRSLINESISHESDVRNAQLQELSKFQSDGLKSQSKNLESEHEAWTQAVQELNAMLRTLISESVSRESDERGMQLQEMMLKLADLEASHADLSSKHFDGHQMHTKNFNELQSQLGQHREAQQNLFKTERRDRAMELENQGEMLAGQIEELLGHEASARKTQVQDIMQRLDSSGLKLDRLMSSYDAHADALALERKAKEEQLADVQNAMQDLNIRTNAIEALTKGSGGLSEGLKLEIGSRCAALKDELTDEHKRTYKQLEQMTGNTRDQLVKMCDNVRVENVKKANALQGSISGLQTALEAERTAHRESHEEHMRTISAERDARNRQNAEIRADYKREIAKEHQERVDAVADQKKDIFKTLRGGSITGQGNTYKPDLSSVNGPVLGGPGCGEGMKNGQDINFDELPELEKLHSISSLGHRLKIIGTSSPKKQETFTAPRSVTMMTPT